MYGFLLAVLLLIGIFMSVVILLQAGKGGGLAAMGGAGSSTDTLIGGRQAATLLTKSTWIAGGLFLAIALALSVMSSRMSQPSSVLQGQFQSAPAGPPPALRGIEATDQAEPAPSGETPAPPTAPQQPNP